ncbi:MAG: hypothetical protein SGI91_00635 [Alphaproteobacteria bacterium]|nr:hypothetical protein [Alphaproteobacteria bacterium]
MVTNVALWSRIACFTPDDPQADFQFTDRLARENGWSKAFAADAVEEYKKFVYLAAVSERHVTPSDVVDQVWHLHLTFTRSYWDDLCGAVLQKPLHHNPTMGGPAERARYRTQYAQTLALYQREFECAAPNAFWPDADVRFAGTAHQSWVDRRTHWIVVKPGWRGLTVAALAFGAVATIGTASATDAPVLAGIDADDLSLWVVGFAVIVVLSAIGSALENAGRRKKRQDDSDNGFDIDFDGGSRKGGKSDKDGGEGGEGGGEGGGDGGGGCGGGCGGD